MSFQCCGQHLNGATRRWDYLGTVLAGGPVLGVQSPQVPHRGLEAVSLMECSGAARSGRQGTQIPKERLQVGTTCLCQRLQSAMISELARVLGGQVPRVGLLRCLQHHLLIWSPDFSQVFLVNLHIRLNRIPPEAHVVSSPPTVQLGTVLGLGGDSSFPV